MAYASHLKLLIKSMVPKPVLESYRRHRRSREHRRNALMTTEDVFTEIYSQNKWGGGDDLASGTFNSGSGSTNEKIVTPYIKRVREWLHSVNSNSKVIVDLGCGDFRVGQQYADMALRYIGVDIVKDLVIYNRTIYGNERVEFHHLNIIEEELPDGDICFIRQVLQHLSNNQITAILPKLKKYQWVIVTEHQPTGECPHPNLDKPHGGDIRVFRNSGVYLDRPPFSIPRQKISLLLEIEGHGFSNGIDPGVIRTFVVTP